jgi:hypothetical protein
MTTEELRIEIYTACRSNREIGLAALAERLRFADSATIFHALFQFAIHSQDLGPASPAAWLLLHVNPRCPISCHNAIQQMLSDWEVSIEEVPFYLAKQFGVATVQEKVAELCTIGTERTQIVLLDAIQYWLRCYEEMQEYKRQ